MRALKSSIHTIKISARCHLIDWMNFGWILDEIWMDEDESEKKFEWQSCYLRYYKNKNKPIYIDFISITIS